MAIKLEMDGATFTFETTEEYEAFTKLHNEVAEVDVAKETIKVGDMVEIIGNTDDYHGHEFGDVGEVLELDGDDYLVLVDDWTQYVPKQDVKKVDATAKKETKKETFYMIKSEYVDTDTDGQREFKKGADEALIGNKREADGLVALVTGYEFIGDVIEHFDGADREGKVAFDVEHVYEVTREEFEAKKAAYLDDLNSKEDADKDVPEGFVKVSFAAAKEGDYFLALVDGYDIEAGEMYVLGKRHEGGLEFIDDEADERNLSWRDEDEEGIVIRKIAEEDAQEDAFKVGDVVKVKSASYHWLKDGVLAEVVATTGGFVSDGLDVEVKPLDGSDAFKVYNPQKTQYIKLKDLTLVDEGLTIDGDVEVSNVNKIEVGDVVRTTRKYTDFLDDSIKEGRLAVVREVRDNGVVTIKQRPDKDYIIINAEDVEDTLELVAKAIK